MHLTLTEKFLLAYTHFSDTIFQEPSFPHFKIKGLARGFKIPSSKIQKANTYLGKHYVTFWLTILKNRSCHHRFRNGRDFKDHLV